MTVALGVMSVPAPVDGDSIRRYETGTLPDGGLWTALRRLSDHNHTGGLNGAPISVSSIPDGSITTPKLDPSVLAPYALTDGSKPFTGQVSMNSDAIIRDHLYFGAKPAGVADATLQRTGAGALRVDTNLGVGVNPALIGAGAAGVTVGQGGMVVGATATPSLNLSSNSYWNGSVNTSLVNASGATLLLDNPGSGMQLRFLTMPAVAPGVAQVLTTRLAVAPTGTLTLTPDAGYPALAFGAGAAVLDMNGANPRLIAQTAVPLELYSGGGVVQPSVDGTNNLGATSKRWAAVYAVNGVIQTSSQDFKEAITPLDPAAAMAAVRATEAVTFDYIAPTRGPEWYDLPDDPEQAEAVLQQRLTAAPLEAAARHQHGFVAEQCSPLFLVGEGQTSPGSSIGVLLAALQNIDSRLAALEGVA